MFIGTDMEESSLRAGLDACLVPGQPAMNVTEWAKLADPFPVRRRADEVARAERT